MLCEVATFLEPEPGKEIACQEGKNEIWERASEPGSWELESLWSVLMQKNMNQKNSKHRPFSRSNRYLTRFLLPLKSHNHVFGTLCHLSRLAKGQSTEMNDCLNKKGKTRLQIR